MKSPANKVMQLEVEHSYKNKFLGRHAIQPRGSVMVLGSSPKAHVRLLGSDVGEVHAYIEHVDGHWYIIDAGSEKGTWVQKHPIVRELIENDMMVAIGGHQLKFSKRNIETTLFNSKKLEKSEAVESGAGTNLYHQMIVKKHGVIYKTELAPMTQFFTFTVNDKAQQFSPPKNEGEVLESQVGDYTFIQRLVRSKTSEMTMANYMHGVLNSDVRRPLITSIGLMTLALVIFLAMPSKPQEELTTPELDQNKFTRMILDAKMMKQKRAEARERQKQLQRAPASGQGVASNDKTPSMQTPTPAKGATPKVISKLKTQGLTALLSKISSRATASGLKIHSQGVAADSQQGIGRATAVAAVGSLQGVGGKAGSETGTHRIGGIGTVGKGGGTSMVAGIGGLAVGAAGSASVGVLEEETEIEGGLDKDVIARVIQSQLGEIRYCYERQLSAEPDLYGKVILRFSIDGNGVVNSQKIGLTTLKSAMVEGCILRRVTSWKFPKPRGGTTVLVSYPFLFKSTN
jgi:outer membrane biosynthesis protein TonB/pSer/pThr/pTyr-binding forkhead associated (FHA) protein